MSTPNIDEVVKILEGLRYEHADRAKRVSQKVCVYSSIATDLKALIAWVKKEGNGFSAKSFWGQFLCAKSSHSAEWDEFLRELCQAVKADLNRVKSGVSPKAPQSFVERIDEIIADIDSLDRDEERNDEKKKEGEAEKDAAARKQDKLRVIARLIGKLEAKCPTQAAARGVQSAAQKMMHFNGKEMSETVFRTTEGKLLSRIPRESEKKTQKERKTMRTSDRAGSYIESRYDMDTMSVVSASSTRRSRNSSGEWYLKKLFQAEKKLRDAGDEVTSIWKRGAFSRLDRPVVPQTKEQKAAAFHEEVRKAQKAVDSMERKVNDELESDEKALSKLMVDDDEEPSQLTNDYERLRTNIRLRLQREDHELYDEELVLLRALCAERESELEYVKSGPIDGEKLSEDVAELEQRVQDIDGEISTLWSNCSDAAVGKNRNVVSRALELVQWDGLRARQTYLTWKQGSAKSYRHQEDDYAERIAFLTRLRSDVDGVEKDSEQPIDEKERASLNGLMKELAGADAKCRSRESAFRERVKNVMNDQSNEEAQMTIQKAQMEVVWLSQMYQTLEARKHLAKKGEQAINDLCHKISSIIDQKAVPSSGLTPSFDASSRIIRRLVSDIVHVPANKLSFKTAAEKKSYESLLKKDKAWYGGKMKSAEE